MRSREWEQAGEAEPGVAKNRVTLPCKRLNPVKQCPLEPHSRPHSDRSLLPPLQPQPTTTPYTVPLPIFTPHRRDATPSAHRPAALYHPSLHTSANFLPAANCHPKPSLALFHSAAPPPPTFATRIDPLPTATPPAPQPIFTCAPPLHQLPPHTAAAPSPPHIVPLPTATPLHPAANFPSLAPPRGLFLPRSARSCSLPEGPKRPPAGPGTGSHRPNTHNRPIAPNTHNRPIAPEHAQKKSGIRCRMPPHGTDAPPTRGRRPYRPLRAGRRTRPAYWPQSTPR